MTIHAGGTGIWDNYHAVLTTGVPPTPQGAVEVYELSAKDGTEINKVVVPVTFGRNLIDPYHGFSQYTVVSGDSLWAIAQQWYSDGNKWPLILRQTAIRSRTPTSSSSARSCAFPSNPK